MWIVVARECRALIGTNRGINAGSKHDLDDLCAAISATQMRFHDIIDKVFPLDKADEALDYIWQGRQVGKLVIEI